jgi:hypothetical protein
VTGGNNPTGTITFYLFAPGVIPANVGSATQCFGTLAKPTDPGGRSTTSTE